MTTLRRPGERQGTFVKTGGPTDGEVAHVAAMARANGLGILLRTNVGGFRRGAWVGEPFKLKSRDWDDYFAELGEAWIHDAILASRYCDGWILGEALRGATGPPETVKYWRDWIGRLRRLESGPLGYVASWQPVPRWVEGAEAYGMQSELQRVAFWGDLDFVGVDMSAPLADGDTAALSPGVLASILDAAEATAATAGRPLALFEIGYPATSRAYETPWRRNGEPAVAPQDASYRLALEAVKSRRSVRAVVVSSWPVGAGVNPLGSDWFSPVGRPAEASVRALFEAIRSR
jgi:hypothetical protein